MRGLLCMEWVGAWVEDGSGLFWGEGWEGMRSLV